MSGWFSNQARQDVLISFDLQYLINCNHWPECVVPSFDISYCQCGIIKKC